LAGTAGRYQNGNNGFGQNSHKEQEIDGPNMSEELTAKQKAFVEELPLNQWNGTKAAIAADYSEKSAAVMACRLLKNPKVIAELEKRTAEIAQKNHVEIAEIVVALREIAFGKAKNTERLKALELLGRHIGFFDQDNQQKAPKTLIVSDGQRMEELERELALLKRSKELGSAICYG
jgi:phage terminase small subunit